MDLINELTHVKADLSAAQALVDGHGAALQAELDAKATIQAAFDTFKADAEAKIAQAALDLQAKQGEFDAKVNELASLQASFDALKAEQKTAEEKANEIVAGLGVQQVKVDLKAEQPSMTKMQALEAYSKISDPLERGRFYAAHKALLNG